MGRLRWTLLEPGCNGIGPLISSSYELDPVCLEYADVIRIVQMDVSMPFMGGMEATELIRAYETHNNLAPVPIIALTAHASAHFSRVEVLIMTFMPPS